MCVGRGLSESVLIGQTALCVALRKLGYTSYHMAECWLDSANDSMSLWHEAIEAKFNGKGRKFAGEDFDKMLWRYDVRISIAERGLPFLRLRCVADYPGCD